MSNQAALGPGMMRALAENFGVEFECFASPLNQHFERFCSLFPDVDRWWGSKGSFFDWEPVSGSFEVNPPFDAFSVEALFRAILRALEASDAPLSYIVIVKHTRHVDVFKESPFLREHKILPRGAACFLRGNQHVSRRAWKADFRCSLLWLQNEAGAARWPPTPKKVAAVVAAFRRVPKPAR